MKDLTTLISTSALWFVIGAFAFYILTSFKVYLLWYIQPKLYQPDTPLFDNYWRDYFRTISGSGKKLLLPSFRYIFRKDDRQFLVVEHENNKPIKKFLSMLKGLTTFLQPYLVFSFIFLLLRAWIASHLLYDMLQITLGEVQLKINYINDLPWIVSLQKYKLFIFFAYGLLCIAIPFLYDREQGAKKAKLYFSNGLIFLSLIGAISFFGARTGQFAAGNRHLLVNLKVQIVALHDSIFKEAVVLIEANDLKQAVEEEDENYVNAIDSLEAAAKLPIGINIDSKIASLYRQELQNYISKKRNQHSLLWFAEGGITENQPVTPASKTYERFYRQKTARSYMKDRAAWNMSEGQTILREIELVAAKKNLFTTDLDKKLKKVLEKLFDLGFDLAIEAADTHWGIQVPKTVKKIASLLLSESYFKSLSERAVDFLTHFETKNSGTVPPAISRLAVKLDPAAADLQQLKKENRLRLIETQNKYLHENIKLKAASLAIELPDHDWIIKEINGVVDYYNNHGSNYERVYDDISAARFINQYQKDKAAELQYRYQFDENTGLEDNIKSMERGAYAKIADPQTESASPEASNIVLKDYNAVITKQTSNKSFLQMANIARFVGSCESGAKLCMKCGLPCAFPVCLRKY